MNLRKPRRKGFVLKMIAGGRGFSVHVSPVLVAGLLAVVVLATVKVQSWVGRSAAGYEAQIRELEKTNGQMRAALALKEREKEQMLALAEQRFDQLWSELQSQDQELAQIGRVVGKKTDSGRRSMKGSRSGGSLNDPLRMKLNYRSLMSAVERRESELGRLRTAAADYKKRIQRERELAALNATPSIWPTRGALSSGFGWRVHPVYGYGRFHNGLDISAPTGTPIYAAAAGRVVQSGWMSGYGNAIVIDHGKGLNTLYGHCSSLAVGVGAFVRKGQTVAYVGSTGLSTGPHLHYEVSVNGAQVDPAPYLVQKERPVSVAKDR